ncbi:hypothetical protein EVB32_103 [Rhizobium phage RHph_TM39]|uniref:Uncharacterized protein n=1 Tax=Rhizobium phage RHph_TM30 TaxID=2509764 RepID=A0A7S5R520_9CAUD|nr:hypothetical protein PQC16_gp103 [Rhizobium phage RHph_TM30]QIG71574.1 hypothetical protein EVB94_103 [Rhizobium phage RHph_TM40]QIG71937.1 hypothetical protein EVB95_103 [Rhizobium phage RHph_TM2_3B]QIG72299.1 hypothetical protein EVB96_103 [Rhizobium phage RHph_TM3_3_6]QIG77091.1 hypothetical protein EVB32_103 [Rhizobium phage RHph_TM39]QIG77429.1 hypothetical protein EVB61_101 [Rhizobium phage RHph_TM21B]QIG77690.1 hypothetical protein EVB64_103 [Rhizobium phage RHph_TM61]
MSILNTENVKSLKWSPLEESGTIYAWSPFGGIYSIQMTPNGACTVNFRNDKFENYGSLEDGIVAAQNHHVSKITDLFDSEPTWNI